MFTFVEFNQCKFLKKLMVLFSLTFEFFYTFKTYSDPIKNIFTDNQLTLVYHRQPSKFLSIVLLIYYQSLNWPFLDS